MTFEEKITEMLITRGLWLNDAKEIIAQTKATKAAKPMEGHWHQDTDGYPATTLFSLWLNVVAVTREWISKNAPDALFKTEFEPIGGGESQT